jgi:hypothetical protein
VLGAGRQTILTTFALCDDDGQVSCTCVKSASHPNVVPHRTEANNSRSLGNARLGQTFEIETRKPGTELGVGRADLCAGQFGVAEVQAGRVEEAERRVEQALARLTLLAALRT